MTKSKIGELCDLFEKEFPIGWLENHDWSNDSASTDSLSKIIEKIDNFEQDAFYLFAQSVLSGEYVVKYNIILRKINALKEILSNGEVFVEGNTIKEQAGVIFNQLLSDYLRFVNKYRFLLSIINNKYSDRFTDYVINAYREPAEDKYHSSLSLLYNILLDMTRLDHLMSYDKKSIIQLILMHTEIEEAIKRESLLPKNRLVIKIMDEKIVFLLKKLLVEDNQEFDYMINFERKHHDTKTINFQFLKQFDSFFDFYRCDSYSNNDSIGKELDKRAYNRSLYIGYYALLMKFYKDSRSSNISQVENILRDFENYYDSLQVCFNKRPFDKYALNTIKNYMYNCLLSFKMTENDYSFNDLKKDVDVIQNIQRETGILNFYPYRKAILYILKLFGNKDSYSKTDLMRFREVLSKYVKRYEEAIAWCDTATFYPIQCAYRECLVRVKDFGAVFIASSFCRPIKYQKLKEELASFKNRLLLLDNEIEIRNEKEQLLDLRKEIDHSNTRQIEILSFFTAIITFIFGTIGFFAESKENDFLHMVFATLGLGAVLMIFVSGIYLVTVRKEKCIRDYFRHPRAWFCIITILLSVALIIWMVIVISKL